VGAPRSGTTLLRNLLNTHPDIALCAFESKFVPSLIEMVNDPTRLSQPRIRADAFRRIRMGRLYYKGLEDRNEAPADEAIYAALEGGDWPNIIRGLLNLWCDKDMHAAAVWGDKTPEYVDAIDTIDSAVPNSRFVHILRDPRDQAMSVKSVWGKSLARSADDWARRLRQARASNPAVDGRYLEVRFEELLIATDRVLDEIVAWLGLSGFTWPLEDVPESDQVGLSRGRRRIEPSVATSRRDGMSVRAERYIAGIAGAAASDAGYEMPPVQPIQLGRVRRSCHAATDHFAMAKYYVRSWGFRRGVAKVVANARETTRRG
jgi:hypothetical protein